MPSIDRPPPLRLNSAVPANLVAEVDAQAADSCWIAGAVGAVAAQVPEWLNQGVFELDDGRLALGYYRLGGSDPTKLEYELRMHPTDFRRADLKRQGWYRFFETSLLELMPRAGGQPSDALCALLGQKYRMVSMRRPSDRERLRVALTRRDGLALPVAATTPNPNPPLTPTHAYLLLGFTPRGDVHARDAVTGKEHTIPFDEIEANFQGVSLPDPS